MFWCAILPICLIICVIPVLGSCEADNVAPLMRAVRCPLDKPIIKLIITVRTKTLITEDTQMSPAAERRKDFRQMCLHSAENSDVAETYR